MNQGNDTITIVDGTDRQQISEYDGHDGPHECEFCSPEPEIMPAPCEREAGERAGDDALRSVPLAEAVSQRWT
jgi:hypothetical protein